MPAWGQAEIEEMEVRLRSRGPVGACDYKLHDAEWHEVRTPTEERASEFAADGSYELADRVSNVVAH